MNNKYPIIVIVVGLIISGAIIYFNPQQQFNSQIISAEEAKEIAEDFVNKKLLQGQINASFSGISEEAGLYKFNLSIQGNEFSSYMTKDGRFFFIEGLDIENFDPATLAPQPSGGDMVGGC